MYHFCIKQSKFNADQQVKNKNIAKESTHIFIFLHKQNFLFCNYPS